MSAAEPKWSLKTVRDYCDEYTTYLTHEDSIVASFIDGTEIDADAAIIALNAHVDLCLERDAARAEVERLRAELTDLKLRVDLDALGNHETTSVKLIEANAEITRLRQMFDVTRHHVCEQLGVPNTTSWFGLRSLIEGLRAEVKQLQDALQVEKDWTHALGEDSRKQQAQLDQIATALGIKQRNDVTDLVTPIKRLFEALEWETACKKAAMKSQERLAAEIRSLREPPCDRPRCRTNTHKVNDGYCRKCKDKYKL